jgi:hypothetical protein
MTLEGMTLTIRTSMVSSGGWGWSKAGPKTSKDKTAP